MRAAVIALVACASCSSKPPKGSHSDTGGAEYASLETQPSTSPADAQKATAFHRIKNVFVIVMENHEFGSIQGNGSAPYLNGTLLAQGAHATRYTTPGDLSPSEPNYIWMEAGSNLAILDDDDADINYRTTRAHLTTQLDTAALPWKAYEEGISGMECPITSGGLYAAKHNPMVFFDDVTDGRDPRSAHCMAHVRPYAELARDLEANDVAAYNFITPDLCDDMHNSDGCVTGDPVANGDSWLARELPRIMAAKVYAQSAIFIVWDEGGPGTPIGMIVVSPFAKPGYAGRVAYTHSSLLRTAQDVFGLRPYLRDAGNANGLDDLFSVFP